MCNMTKKNPFCTILKVKNNNKELKNNSHNKHMWKTSARSPALTVTHAIRKIIMTQLHYNKHYSKQYFMY